MINVLFTQMTVAEGRGRGILRIRAACGGGEVGELLVCGDDKHIAESRIGFNVRLVPGIFCCKSLFWIKSLLYFTLVGRALLSREVYS